MYKIHNTENQVILNAGNQLILKYTYNNRYAAHIFFYAISLRSVNGKAYGSRVCFAYILNRIQYATKALAKNCLKPIFRHYLRIGLVIVAGVAAHRKWAPGSHRYTYTYTVFSFIGYGFIHIQ